MINYEIITWFLLIAVSATLLWMSCTVKWFRAQGKLSDIQSTRMDLHHEHIQELHKKIEKHITDSHRDKSS